MRGGVCTLLMRPSRLVRAAIVLKPSTLLRLHRALTTRKYRRLFSSTVPKKPGPKGPSQDVIAAVVDMKQRNPTWGCPRIAQQITLAFGIPMNKDVVRRILAARYLVGSGTGAVTRRPLLGCVRGFPLRARIGVAVVPFPVPAASHAACGFTALRAPAPFISRVMRPLSSLRRDADSRRLRSCSVQGGFINPPLPSVLTPTSVQQ